MDEAILTATRRLLAEQGYAALTVDAVAAGARIGKAAIYRRFATKQEMVFAAAVHGRDLSAQPDAGSLQGDLTNAVKEIVRQVTTPAASAAIMGLLADLASSGELARQFRDVFVASEQQVIAELLDRAVARGELPRRPDVALVHALLTGPVFTTVYLQRRPAKTLPRKLAAIVARFLTGDEEPGQDLGRPGD